MADCALADCAVGLPAHTERRRAEHAANENHEIDPKDVAECAHDREAVGNDRRESVPHERQQDQHVDVRRHCLKGGIFAFARFFLVAELVRGLHADELHVRNGQQNRDEARAHRGDLCAHEVGEHEHHKTGRYARKCQIRDNALEALLAVGHPDHDKGDDENAEHVEPADHRGVERHGRYARVNQSRAAVDGGQACAAPGGRGRVTKQRNCDGGDRVKAKGYEERSCNRRRSACACCAL